MHTHPRAIRVGFLFRPSRPSVSSCTHFAVTYCGLFAVIQRGQQHMAIEDILQVPRNCLTLCSKQFRYLRLCKPSRIPVEPYLDVLGEFIRAV